MTVTAPVMRYHGGKFRMADWIIGHFPPHTTYCEPFGGAAGVLMRKPRSDFEVWNDLDEEVHGLFRVLRDPESAQRLAEVCSLTPYSRQDFEAAYAADPDDLIEQSRRLLVRSMQGFGSAGATKGKTGFRSYSGGEGRAGNPAEQWARYPCHIASFAERLAGVILECRPAVDVMRLHDTPQTLHYVDPPYLPGTRAEGRYYRHEMTIEEHTQLLRELRDLRGMVVLSGYESGVYADALDGWSRYSRASQANGPSGSVSREEVLWLNESAVDAAGQMSLFASEAPA